jgi:hypothetical protein
VYSGNTKFTQIKGMIQMAIGTKSNTTTPRELMAQAVERADNVSGMNPAVKAEVTVALADAAARMHAANQAEVENLFRVVESKTVLISAQQRIKAAEKLAAILGLD